MIFIVSGNILGKIAWKVSRTPEMKRLIKKNDQIVVKFKKKMREKIPEVNIYHF